MNISRPFGFICPRGMEKGYVQAPGDLISDQTPNGKAEENKPTLWEPNRTETTSEIKIQMV